jgi:hypothetical protein
MRAVRWLIIVGAAIVGLWLLGGLLFQVNLASVLSGPMGPPRLSDGEHDTWSIGAYPESTANPLYTVREDVIYRGNLDAISAKRIRIALSDAARRTVLDDEVTVVAGSVAGRIDWRGDRSLSVAVLDPGRSVGAPSDSPPPWSQDTTLLVVSYRLDEASGHFVRVEDQ